MRAVVVREKVRIFCCCCCCCCCCFAKYWLISSDSSGARLGFNVRIDLVLFHHWRGVGWGWGVGVSCKASDYHRYHFWLLFLRTAMIEYEKEREGGREGGGGRVVHRKYTRLRLRHCFFSVVTSHEWNEWIHSLWNINKTNTRREINKNQRIIIILILFPKKITHTKRKKEKKRDVEPVLSVWQATSMASFTHSIPSSSSYLILMITCCLLCVDFIFFPSASSGSSSGFRVVLLLAAARLTTSRKEIVRRHVAR